VLVRTDSGEWKFDADTLNAVGELWSRIEKRGVRYGADITQLSLVEQIRKNLVPAALKDRFFLGNELWQWMGLALLLVIAVLADYLWRFLFTPIVRWAVKRYIEEAGEETVRATVIPIALLVGVLVFSVLLGLLQLVGDALVVVTGAVTVVVTVASAWVGFMVTDLVTIPNGGLTNEPLENVAERPSIRRTMNATITYDTPREPRRVGIAHRSSFPTVDPAALAIPPPLPRRYRFGIG